MMTWRDSTDAGLAYDAMALATAAALALGFHRKDIDADNRIARFTNGTKSFLYMAGTFPLNGHTGVRIARDKADTEAVLSAAGFKVPGSQHVFLVPEWADERAPGRELSDAFRIADQIGYPLFAKPLDSSLGRLAQVIETPDELGHHLVKIGRLSWGAILQPVLTGIEHRIFVFDGRVRFTYAKQRGDGAPNANPNAGGLITDFATPGNAEVDAWASGVARAMGLRVCALDVFSDAPIAEEPRAATIIEINANPILKTVWDLGETETVRSIWYDVIERHARDLDDWSGA